MKKTNRRIRRKLNRIKAICSICILALVLFFCIGSGTSNAEAEKETITYTVSQGETLWTIAKQYIDEKTDIREYIYNIKKLNNMNTSTIYAGQTIQLYK